MPSFLMLAVFLLPVGDGWLDLEDCDRANVDFFFVFRLGKVIFHYYYGTGEIEN